MEKQLAKPQGPQVATALVQVLFDWTYLFPQEELGARSRALLAQPRYSIMAAGCAPSPAVLAMQEEMRLGIPPVAPIRGEDFIRWMYRGAGPDNGAMGGALGGMGSAGSSSSSIGSFPAGAYGLPGGAPPAISTQAVPHLCQRMQADAHRMTAALATCRTAAAGRRMGELTAAMDAAYREAERCSQWRRRVQEYTQHCDDPGALSAVLAATDTINTALQNWQQFTGREVYDTMRIIVPPAPAGGMSRAAAPAAKSKYDIDVLLGITQQSTPPPAPTGHPQQTQQQPQQQPQQQQPFDPFAPPKPAAAVSTPKAGGALLGPSRNPFAPTVTGPAAPATSARSDPPSTAASPPSTSSSPWTMYGNTGAVGAAGSTPAAAAAAAAASRPAGTATQHRAQPSLSDWDPFGPSSLPPILPPPSPASAAANGDARSGSLPGATSAAPSSSEGLMPTLSWALFGDDGSGTAATTHGSFCLPSPGLSSSQPSGAFYSHPTSPSSVSSTPGHGGGSSAANVVNDGSAMGKGGSGGGVGGFGQQRAPLQVDVPGGPMGQQPQTLQRVATPQAPSTATVPGLATTAAAAPAMRPYPPGTLNKGPSNPNLVPTAAAPAPVLDSAGRPAVSVQQTPSPVHITAPSSAFANGFHQASSPGGSGGGGAALSLTVGQLDWRPEYERLAADLRAMFAASSWSPGSGSGAAAGSVLLPGILTRVNGLCEALAAQHARQVATLEKQLSGARSAAGSMDVGSAVAHEAGRNGGVGGSGGVGAGLGGGPPMRQSGSVLATAAHVQQGGGTAAFGGTPVAASAAAAGTSPPVSQLRSQSSGPMRPQVGPLQQGLHQPSYKVNGFADLGATVGLGVAAGGGGAGGGTGSRVAATGGTSLI